jgi:hypothetical protein
VTGLDAASLVVIAGRSLGIGTTAALARIDITAAQAALAEAPPAPALPDPASAAAAWTGLVHALLRHPPFPGHRQHIAVAAGLQFLALHGWQADLDPPATAAVVVEALASGRLAPAGATAWLMPRLSPRPAPRPREGAMHAIQRGLKSVLPVRVSGGAGMSVDGRMLARFTDQAAAAVSLARQEARRLGHDRIDPEHILLGLTRQEDSVAGRALHRLGISPDALRHQVEESLQPGQATPAGPIRPSRPRGQKVLSSALPEALAYGHCDRHGCPWMSTGHLLLAQFHDDGAAAQTLAGLGAGENHVRSAVSAVLAEAEQPPGDRAG